MTRTEAARKAAYARAAALSPERRSEIARLGGLALVERYGRIGLAKRAAKWRRHNPSCLTRQVMSWLDEMGQSYELERCIDGWFADITLKGCKRLIEVDGHIWHSNNQVHGEDREGRDALKLATWRRSGRRVLVLSETEISDGTGRQKLAEFLAS